MRGVQKLSPEDAQDPLWQGIQKLLPPGVSIIGIKTKIDPQDPEPRPELKKRFCTLVLQLPPQGHSARIDFSELCSKIGREYRQFNTIQLENKQASEDKSERSFSRIILIAAGVSITVAAIVGGAWVISH